MLSRGIHEHDWEVLVKCLFIVKRLFTSSWTKCLNNHRSRTRAQIDMPLITGLEPLLPSLPPSLPAANRATRTKNNGCDDKMHFAKTDRARQRGRVACIAGRQGISGRAVVAKVDFCTFF